MKKLEYRFQKNNLMINIQNTVAMSYHIMQNKFSVRSEITYKSKELAYKPSTIFLVIHIEELGGP
jgi:hypothetical protein